MREFIFITALLFITASSYATTSPVSKDPLARDFMVNLPGTSIRISPEDYLTFSPAEYKTVTGKKMKLTERFKMNMSQRMLKKFIRKDGSINMAKAKKYGFFSQYQWHWGGFALGFFFSVFGVIATLFFQDEYKWDRFWTAVRTATAVLLLATAIAAAAL
jgi:hypothetical protein